MSLPVMIHIVDGTHTRLINMQRQGTNIFIIKVFCHWEKRHTTMAIRPCQRGLPTANSLQADAPANLLAHRIANRYQLKNIALNLNGFH